MNEKHFLAEGKLTKIDNNVESTVKAISGDDYEFILNTLQWIRDNLREDISNKSDLFRKRTASEIILSGFQTGCSDRTLAFVALSRGKGIPAKLIDTIMLDYFEPNNPDNNLIGHVFAKVFIDDNWYLVDPTAGYISINKHPGLRRYVIFAEGIDFEDGKMLSGSLRPIFQNARKQYEDDKDSVKDGRINIQL